MNNSEPHRFIWIDNIRIFSAFAIVCIHTVSGVAASFEFGSVGWWTGNIYDSSVRWGVPLFVMVSGFLLLAPSKNEDWIRFYKKRASRILIPLVFWSIFYLVWSVVSHDLSGESVLLFTIKRLLAGAPYYHMWFLYMLLGLYFFVPFIKTFVKQLDFSQLLLICIVMFCMAAVHIGVSRFYYPRQTSVFVNRFLLYLPYFLAGYLIGNTRRQGYKAFVGLLFLCSVLMTIAGVYFVTKISSFEKGRYFHSYFSLTVIPMSLSLFYLSKFIKRPIINGNITKKLANLTLGVYLVHPFFLDILGDFGIRATSFNVIFSVSFIALLIFGLSIVASQIISTIPFFRKVI